MPFRTLTMAATDSPEGEKLDGLATLIETYETRRFPREFGAGYEIRTRDIQLGKLTLYQLS